ncbi:MAG: Hsp33 family molecular chaperone HslO [Gammaproteobacteria bacterium]|nr:Hsp33 family molecular chaperone HslO [Gammaproteobacteria bacterium]MBU1777626.1 Hsp33 family molecular chaperone HslO [Gammaproteobacteria bacterium]MBU1969246.1 Hsp33 family molecular chaperone HslO [Gammaproteobacteria bacterium]
MKNSSDTLRRFLFEHASLRGEIVRLDATWQAVIERHDYPDVLRDLMGELCVAAVLLAATLKLQGAMVLQIHGKGALKLLVVECTGDLELRATAKWEGDLAQGTLQELVGDGRFVITLDPKDGNQAYQGIVALEGDSIAEILQNYMTRSEQLETRLWLAADGKSAGGMLLQKLPQPNEVPDDEPWENAVQIANTLKPEELLNVPSAELVHLLYHEEDIRLFDEQDVVFRCTCSRDNVARMLRMMGREEVEAIIAERGDVEVHCEFCNQRYVFDRVDANAAFSDVMAVSANKTLH